ncbi:MAG: hypothetical protein QOH23_1896 [Gaiellaceae bacterium]|jgi:hypothetical protein|nr:hypothetical protein [Gaiellaceae bacterium]
MKRYLLLFAVATAALATIVPATAAAATTFRGSVVAKDAARKAIVTASAGGTVRTVRLHGGFNRVRVGSTVAVRGVSLPDGTFSAATARRIGKARGAHVRGTVVKRLGARLVISAGGSVFALRVSGKQGAAEGGGLKPGDRVDCGVRFHGGTPETTNGGIHQVGHDGRLELEGIYLDTTADGSIELAVVHRGKVVVAVPAGTEVPAFQPGDEITLVVTVEADGSFDLVKAENENEPGDGGVEIGKEQFTVAGILAAIGQDAVAVKVEGREEPVRCRFEEFDTTGFAVGQHVVMTCKYSDGRLELVELKPGEDTPPPVNAIGVVGTISELDASHVTVENDEHGPTSCLVPAGMNLLGFVTGDAVKLYCVKNDDGHFVVKALISDHAAVTPDGSWFVLEGTIAELTTAQISLDVDGRNSPVSCAVAEGADLSGFAVGDAVTMKCKLIGDGFTLKLLESETAHYELPS